MLPNLLEYSHLRFTCGKASGNGVARQLKQNLGVAESKGVVQRFLELFLGFLCVALSQGGGKSESVNFSNSIW